MVVDIAINRIVSPVEIGVFIIMVIRDSEVRIENMREIIYKLEICTLS